MDVNEYMIIGAVSAACGIVLLFICALILSCALTAVIVFAKMAETNSFAVGIDDVIAIFNVVVLAIFCILPFATFIMFVLVGSHIDKNKRILSDAPAPA